MTDGVAALSVDGGGSKMVYTTRRPFHSHRLCSLMSSGQLQTVRCSTGSLWVVEDDRFELQWNFNNQGVWSLTLKGMWPSARARRHGAGEGCSRAAQGVDPRPPNCTACLDVV